jgi:hypothetical protein
MMVHRTRGDRGNLEIDIRLPGFGRFRKSAGTARATVAKRRIALLRRLAENGQLETLRLILDGSLSWPHVEQAAKKGRLENATLLSDLLVDGNLQHAIDVTLPSMGKAGTRARYGLALRQLEQLGVLTSDARVRDLLRDDWSERFQAWDVAPATKNGVRRAVSRFLTRYLGDKHHEFRRRVLHEDRWPKVDEPRRIRGFALEQFWPLMGHVPAHLVPSYVLLAATGMRVGEYLNDDAISLDEINRTITVVGKTGPQVYAIARPVWPYVRAAVPCRVARRRSATAPATLQEDPRYKKRVIRE